MSMSTQSNNTPRQPQIDPQNVPEPFRPLILYAQKWGISDDGYLWDAVYQAPIEELKELIKIVSDFEVEGFDEWLGNPGKENYTKEWRAFILLIDAYDLAKSRLRLENDNKFTD